jgi:DnaJ-class molecular chaperone
MPNKTLCPKCHGQRTVSCLECHGSGKKSIMAIPFGDCKECGGTGRRRCDVCGGMGEVENEQPYLKRKSY